MEDKKLETIKNNSNDSIEESDEIKAMYEEIAYVGSEVGKAELNKKKTIKIISNVIFFVVLVFLLFSLIAIYVAKENGMTPQMFGFTICYVESGSMEPTIATYSTIICHKTDANKLKVDDVVTFYNLKGTRITHRIVEVINDNGDVSYRTKGDNPLNDVDEEVLTPDRVIGVMLFKLF